MSIGTSPLGHFHSGDTKFGPQKNIHFYYMEESVLLGTKPLVDTPLHPGPKWRIFHMSPLWVSYRSMTSRFLPFAFVELVSPYNKKNITRWLEDMNCMFSWQEQYLTREISFLPLEHKIHIFSPPCNILYIYLYWKDTCYSGEGEMFSESQLGLTSIQGTRP